MTFRADYDDVIDGVFLLLTGVFSGARCSLCTDIVCADVRAQAHTHHTHHTHHIGWSADIK